MNNIILIGNLTKDPELAVTNSGLSVCKFSIAVNRSFSKTNEVDFFNVVTWRGLAENCHQYLSKGKKVAVQGRVENRNYEDKQGNKRYATEIVANEVQFLSPVTENTTPQQGTFDQLVPVSGDDLPF